MYVAGASAIISRSLARSLCAFEARKTITVRLENARQHSRLEKENINKQSKLHSHGFFFFSFHVLATASIDGRVRACISCSLRRNPNKERNYHNDSAHTRVLPSFSPSPSRARPLAVFRLGATAERSDARAHCRSSSSDVLESVASGVVACSAEIERNANG